MPPPTGVFMRRLLFAAPLGILLFAASCGDGTDKADPTPTAAASQEASPSDGSEQPQVPDKPLPSPTPIPDDLPIVQVVAGTNGFRPTRQEFAALATSKVQAGGKTYEGVSLALLAEKAGATPDTIATIQGTRSDNLRLGAVRFPLSELATTTVLYLDEGGHMMLASSSIPQEQWLKDVTGVALQK